MSPPIKFNEVIARINWTRELNELDNNNEYLRF